jgi:hypothetical protein
VLPTRRNQRADWSARCSLLTFSARSLARAAAAAAAVASSCTHASSPYRMRAGGGRPQGALQAARDPRLQHRAPPRGVDQPRRGGHAAEDHHQDLARGHRHHTPAEQGGGGIRSPRDASLGRYGALARWPACGRPTSRAADSGGGGGGGAGELRYAVRGHGGAGGRGRRRPVTCRAPRAEG